MSIDEFYEDFACIATISRLARRAHGIAVNNGFYEEGRSPSFGEQCALIHSEVSEALEAYRDREGNERIAEELADAVIRILDCCAHRKLDIGSAIIDKMEKNRTRPYRHGGKAL
jgi:NTP pyrophosphatase (non-canonical NTP hydrolase)